MTDDTPRTRGLSLGTAFGGRIVVQLSTLVMLVVLALVFSTNGGQDLTRRGFTIGLVLALLLFVSVFLHELAHAATARALGRRVHEVVITLWGGHTSFDAQGITPRVAGLTAAAGPLANLAIGGIGTAVLATGALDVTLIQLLEGDITAYGLVRYLVIANFLLAAFNALPGIPMDGGRVLESIVWAVTGNRWRGVIVAAWGGRVVAVAVVVAAFSLPLVQGRSLELFDVLWAGLVFMILWPAASQSLTAARRLDRQDTVTVGAHLVPAVPVEHSATVADALARAEQAGAREVVVLGADGVAAGHFPVAIGHAVPDEDRAVTLLSSVLMPVPRGTEVGPDLGGEELVEAINTWWGRTDGWVVADEGRVVGVVRLSDLMEALLER